MILILVNICADAMELDVNQKLYFKVTTMISTSHNTFTSALVQANQTFYSKLGSQCITGRDSDTPHDSKMWLYFSVLSLVCLILAIVLAYKTSTIARFYVKYYFYLFLHMFAALYTICVVGIFHPRSPDNFHRVGSTLYWMTSMILSVKVEAEGLEHLPSRKDKNCVIVANHQSSLDMLVMLKLAPGRTTFLAKKELLFAPLFGLAAWLSGVVFVNRGNSQSARKVMDNAVKWVKEQKVRDVLYCINT